MEWAREGQELARKHVYRNGELPRLILLNQGNGQPNTQAAPELPEDYAANARNLARQQIAVAAYRLSDVIDSIFARKEASK
jgi:hypothetical protein